MNIQMTHLKTWVLKYNNDHPYPPHSVRLSLHFTAGFIVGFEVGGDAYYLYLGPIRITIY